MDTNGQIQDLLLNHPEASVEAKALAAEHEVHSLAWELKALYEKIFGRVSLDVHDWHWQATALKNALNAPPATPLESGEVQAELVDHAALTGEVDANATTIPAGDAAPAAAAGDAPASAPDGASGNATSPPADAPAEPVTPAP